MKVLVACEYSGIVRDAFINRGHKAISCDILPTETPGPHIQGDVLEVIGNGYDLMIAHPPCTYFANAGLHYLKTKPGRYEELKKSFEFLKCLWNAPIPRICIENPVGWLNTNWLKPTQIIQPYFFGDREVKTTCLWMKGLPPLFETAVTERPAPKGYFIRKSGVKAGKKYACNFREGKSAKARAKTFPGTANAMAEQWG